MKKSNNQFAGATIIFAIAASAHAANLAFDNASASAYDDGWQTGDNGGSGWGPWTLTANGATAGFFVSSSIINGNGLDDGDIGGFPGDRDIDTTMGPGPDFNLTTPVSLGMFAERFNLAQATRGFTGGPLDVGQTFIVDFDNGFVNPGGEFGIGLLNAGGDTLWELQYAFGDEFYSYTDPGSFGNASTSVAPGTEGLTLALRLLDPGIYEMSLRRRDGTSDFVELGFLQSNADQEITQVQIFADSVGFDSINDFSSDFFINSMAVIPEPSSALLALVALGLPIWRRR